MTTIGIVDDHPLIIEGLVQMLDTSGSLRLC